MAILGNAKTTWVLGKDSVLDYIAADPNGCWIWTKSLNTVGYGTTRVKVDGKWRGRLAHRLAYEELVGPIPPGLVIDHLCRVRRCVNPDHLEPVTPFENVFRSEIAVAGINARKTHCPQGHPYDEKNTLVRIRDGRPGRYCRACKAAWRRAKRQRAAS